MELSFKEKKQPIKNSLRSLLEEVGKQGSSNGKGQNKIMLVSRERLNGIAVKCQQAGFYTLANQICEYGKISEKDGQLPVSTGAIASWCHILQDSSPELPLKSYSYVDKHGFTCKQICETGAAQEI